MSEIKILLADDHAMFRDGLKSVLEQETDFKIVGEVENGSEVVDKVEELKPDLLLLDLSFKDIDGIEILKSIKKLYSNLKVIILTMHKNEIFLRDAIFSHVDGYVLKTENFKELKRAIFNVMQGGMHLSKESKDSLNTEEVTDQKESRSAEPEIYLTQREKEIIKFIATGLTYQEIAEKLFISHYTVINHRQNIAHKLNLKSNIAIVKYATDNQII